MSIINHLFLLQRVHDRIMHKSTGTPQEFADRLNISVRTLYRIMEELKDLGAEIAYSTERSSYVYNNDVKINIHLKIGQLDKNQIKGGKSLVDFEVLPFLAVCDPNLAVDSYWASPNP